MAQVIDPIALAERITAATDALKALAAGSTPGPWLPERDGVSGAIWTSGPTVLGGTILEVNFDHLTGDHHPEGDLALVITLHRTLEAQITLLESLLAWASQVPENNPHVTELSVALSTQALADAVLTEGN